MYCSITVIRKIESLNREINETIIALKNAKLECEQEQSNDTLMIEAFAKRKKIEAEWQKLVEEYNKLREVLNSSRQDMALGYTA